MNIWDAIDHSHNDLQLLEDLIAKNPITNLDQIRDELTPLMWASMFDHISIVKALLDLRADVNQKNNRGETPLMLAAEKSHKKILKLLIGYGAKVNLTDNKGQDALAFARKTDNADIAKLLIGYGAKDDLKAKKEKDTPRVSNIATQTDVLKTLNKPTVEDELKNKEKKSNQKSSKTDLTKSLQKLIIDVNKEEDKKKHTTIWEAIDQANDNPQTLAELITENNIPSFDEPRNGETPLIYAIKQNHIKSAEFLIKHEANANLRDKDGKTALICSATINNLDITKSLIEHKADLNLQDNEGYTALMLTKDLEIAKLLVANGADIDLKDKKGHDALYNAIRHGHCDDIGKYLGKQASLAYRKILKDILDDPEMQFLKIPKDLENAQEILIEIMHTLVSHEGDSSIGPSRVREHYKYKQKQLGTDYRMPIKNVVFKSENVEEALAELLRSKELSKDDMGRERVLVAQFPNLTQDKFNTVAGKAWRFFIEDEKSPALRSIILDKKKCIIALIQPTIKEILDLHGFDVKQAEKNTLEYLETRYFKLEEEASLLVGKGIHSKPGTDLPPITANTIKLLERLKRENFVKSYEQLPDRFIIRFRPPIALSEIEFPQARLDKNHCKTEQVYTIRPKQ